MLDEPVVTAVPPTVKAPTSAIAKVFPVGIDIVVPDWVFIVFTKIVLAMVMFPLPYC